MVFGLCQPGSLMFSLSGPGYWQEFIVSRTIQEINNKPKVALAIQLRALSILLTLQCCMSRETKESRTISGIDANKSQTISRNILKNFIDQRELQIIWFLLKWLDLNRE